MEKMNPYIVAKTVLVNNLNGGSGPLDLLKKRDLLLYFTRHDAQ